MNQYGYIKVSRRAFRDAWWIEPREFSRFEAWLDCIQLAQWKPGRVNGEPLARGEFLASVRTLAHRWHWGERRVRTFITEATHQTTHQTSRLKTQRETQQGTVYLIVKYDEYQGGSNESDTSKDTASDTAKDTATQPRKEEEQRKNKYIGEFEAAWAIYPRRSGGNPKNRAEQAWCARIREGVAAAVMLDGVRRYAAYCEAEGKIGTPYVQQASTFLGKSRGFEESWATGRAAAGGPILSAAGNPILSIAELREQKRRDYEEVNRLRVARGEAPVAIA